MKVPYQTDPSGPNGAQKKSRNYVPSPLGPNFRNSYEFCTNFVQICRKFVRNLYEIRANLADSYEIRVNVARAACEFHHNLQIRANFVRISEISKFQQKITQIHVKFANSRMREFGKFVLRSW